MENEEDTRHEAPPHTHTPAAPPRTHTPATPPHTHTPAAPPRTHTAPTSMGSEGVGSGVTGEGSGVKVAAMQQGGGSDGGDLLTILSDLAKQKKHKEILQLCNHALEDDPNNDKILEKKVRALCQLGQFRRAYTAASQWLKDSPDHPIAKRELKRLQTVLKALDQQYSDEEEDKEAAEIVSSSSAASNVVTTTMTTMTTTSRRGDNVRPAPSHTVRVLPPQPPNRLTKQNNEEPRHFCSFCDLTFDRQEELDTHCQSDLHKKRLASDESQEWKYRPPPRGHTGEDYVLCHRFCVTQRCPYGEQCTRAHSEAELAEWRDRFAFRRQQLQQAKDQLLHCNTFVDQLMEQLSHPDGPQVRLVQNVDFAKIHVNCDLKVNMSTKKCTNAWTFTITSKLCMQAVGLMDLTNRNYFHISSISVGPKKTQKYQNLETHCQEWVNPDSPARPQGEYVYRVKVVFKTDIYGTFQEKVAVGFGGEAVVGRHLQVESSPVTDADKVSREMQVTAARRWAPDAVTLTPFQPPYTTWSDEEEQLLAKYVLPAPERLTLSDSMLQPLGKDSYRLWMHQMLYVEEMAQLGFVQRFNVTGSLQLVNRFLLMPGSQGSLSQAKYSREGELFARLPLGDVLSEDSSAGRLILQNALCAWVAPAKAAGTKDKIKVYEAHIEEKGKNFVFLRLSANCVEELDLSCDQDFSAQIQFQLNRLSKCEMHSAVDGLSTLNIVFPDTTDLAPLPHPPQSQLSKLDGVLLNAEQREAIVTITSPSRTPYPPLLIIGPFGTGKTYTLAQAAKLVVEQEDTRILICTHSNSAADLYIKDFLHPYVECGHSEARPLRLYYRHRWVNTVPEVILPYSLWCPDKHLFRQPSLDDVSKHRVVITTLSTARYISDIGLPKDFFTHIFIDEAAQSLECESLIPLRLASDKTRIVLAGDHMQISPSVYSDYARQQGFQTSLLERLYDLYPSGSPCMVMLVENYRSHQAIVHFTSHLFYQHRLLASGNQAPHPHFHPLTFCHAKGLEEQHANSTGFYNLSEVYEIVDRVDELRRQWPEEWGDMDSNGIGVVAPYHDQVVRIRNELRKKRIHNVSVERVLNVQGKQYRVVIISTVRTRSTCSMASSEDEEFLDYGFLSNVKLLNTAITRAQSLVMVVGDPLSLCLVGKCRKVWEYFLEQCQENDSLFGITWAQLRASLDRVEVAKTFVLNPLAPEFVPNRRFHFTFQSQDQGAGGGGQQGGPMPYIPVNPFLPHAAVQHNPYQMVYPPMMPYYNLPVYSPYMAPVWMRSPGTAGLRLGHQPRGGGGVGRGGLQPAAALPVEGVRRVEVGPPHAARSPHRQSARARLPLFHMPRVPLHYSMPQIHPLLAPTPAPLHHPAAFYLNPDDPRLAPLQGPIPPLYAPHTYITPQIRGPTTVAAPYSVIPGALPFHQGAPLQVHPHPPSTGATPTPTPPRRDPPGEEASDPLSSPDAKPSAGGGGGGEAGLGVQVLPNVKHVPSYLRPGGGAASSQSSSRSSTPMGGPFQAVPPYLQEAPAPVSERPYSPANYAARGSPLTLMAGDLPDRAPTADRDPGGGPEWEAAAQQPASPSSTVTDPMGGGSAAGKAPPVGGRKVNNPKKLSLRTGFSRQFSDDLPTPTAITDLVRMIDIDEALEDGRGGEGGGDSPPSQRTQLLTRLNGRNAALSSLQLDLASAQHRQHHHALAGHATPPCGASSGSALNGERAAFAIMMDLGPGAGDTLAPDISLMEPQTPRTPSGFVTPGGEVAAVDPQGILKSLNISSSPPMLWGASIHPADDALP